MAFSWHTISTSSAYEDSRFDFISRAEGLELGVYYDAPRPPNLPNPTIGYGFNLENSTLLEATIKKIFYPEGGVSSYIGNDSSFAEDIADIIADGFSVYPSKQDLQAALDAVMTARSAYWENELVLNPLITHPTTTRETFTFNNAEETRSVFDINITSYENSVNSWIAAIPLSNERIVLTSLAYAGILDNSSTLKAAIVGDDRAEAWVQIRYLSNKGSLTADASILNKGYYGQAARRYAESDLFGLYKPGTLDDAEARQIFQAISRHEEQIYKYDQRYGHLLDNASTKFGYEIENLDEITAPAKELLIDLYVDSQGIELLPHNIYIDHASITGGSTEKNIYNGDFKNTLILGGVGNDVINGGAGVDVIYGEENDDTLIFRQSDVTVYDTIKEYYDGGEDSSGTDHDTLRLEFRGDEWNSNSELRAEIAELYGNMVVSAPSGNFTYTFQNLNLQIAGFEDMEVWVDGKKISLAPQAYDDYVSSYYNPGSSGAQTLYGNLFNPSATFLLSLSDYSISEKEAVSGTFTTTDGGSITILSDGSYTYVPPSASYQGQDSYTYTITDVSTGVSGGSTATIYFAISEKVTGFSGSTYSAASNIPAIHVTGNMTDFFGSDYNDRQGITRLDSSYITMNGLDGEDVIDAFGASGELFGGNGNDVVGIYSYDIGFYTPSDFILDGGAGNDLIYVNTFSLDQDPRFPTSEDYYDFGSLSTTVYGRGGDDYILCLNPLNDSIYGGSGNDTVEIRSLSTAYTGAYGIDILDGGSGIDTLKFFSRGVDINLAMGTAIYSSNSSTVNTVTGFENIIGSIEADKIYGSSANNILDGGDGNDEIYGANGNDTLIGGKGNDTFIIKLNEGVDTIVDTNGNDKIVFGTGITASTLTYIREKDDLLIKHNDTSLVRLIDHFYNADNIETLQFSDNSTLSLKNVLKSSLIGSASADVIISDPGNVDVTIDGRAGDDIIRGGIGNDLLNGGSGNDVVYGGDGNDTFIYRYTENIGKTDAYYGGKGTDTLALYFKSSEITQAIKDDVTAYLNYLSDPSNINTSLSTGAEYTFSEFDLTVGRFETLKVFVDGIEQPDGVIINVINGTEGNDLINGTSGKDVIFGKSGNDTISAGNGDDRLDGGGGDDILYGEDGGDTLVYSYNDNLLSDDYYYGGYESDTLELRFTNTISKTIVEDIAAYYSFVTNPSNINLSANTGAEYTFSDFNLTAGRIENIKVILDGWELDVSKFANAIHGTNGNDYAINGTIGNDLIFGHNGYDAMAGDDGDDVLIGGLGEDEMYGGDGNDILIGGFDADLMSGGAGADIFVYHGSDIYDDYTLNLEMPDFNPSEGDILYLSDLLTNFIPGESNINDYLSITREWNGYALTIDRDGLGTAFDATDKIYAVGPTSTGIGPDVIDELFNNRSIIIA